MSDSSFVGRDGGIDQTRAARPRGALTAVVFCVALLLVAIVAQAVYVHFIHGIPVIGEVDPVRTVARVVLVAVVMLGGYPICSMIADRRSSLARIADALISALGDRRWLIRIVPVSLALVMVAVWALRAFPNSGDEYNYLFQAATLEAGRLWNPIPQASDLFAFVHTFMQDGKWVSQYAPGWSAVLAAGHLLGLPYWSINPLLGIVLLSAACAVALRRAGMVAATSTGLLLGLTIFFLFNAASYFAHIYAALFGLVFCAAAETYRHRPRPIPAVIAGAAIGALALSRPFDAALFCLPYLVAILWRLTWAHLRFAAFGLVSLLPLLGAAMLYNAAITGDPLLPVTNWGYPALKLGLFDAVHEGGTPMPLAERLQQALSRVYLLAEWTSPIFLILFGSSFAHLWRRRRLVPADFVIFVFVLAYITYPGYGGVQYGPRYYFEAYPLMAITCGTALASWLAVDAEDRASRFAVALLALHLLVAVAAMAPFMRAMHRIVDERMDLYDLVDEQNVSNAVVVVTMPTGSLDPMGPKDLTRNGIDVSGPVIYALARDNAVARLRTLYPTRQLFIYRRDIDAPRGRLEPAS
jgi:hypothetical protein